MRPYTVQHTQIGSAPYWYHLETTKDLATATTRARNYALDHGGYVCVRDAAGNVVFGTDPAELDRAILSGCCVS